MIYFKFIFNPDLILIQILKFGKLSRECKKKKKKITKLYGHGQQMKHEPDITGL